MSHPVGSAPGSVDPNPVWPRSLARVAAVRFARRSSHFEATVRFYRDLVRFPVHETFEDSYSSDGVIFGLPDATLTFEIVRSEQPVQVDPHDQLCLYLPDRAAMEAARRGLVEAGIEPVASHPYWAANGAATYRDPDGRELIFAPFIYGADERVAPASSESGASAPELGAHDAVQPSMLGLRRGAAQEAGGEVSGR